VKKLKAKTPYKPDLFQVSVSGLGKTMNSTTYEVLGQVDGGSIQPASGHRAGR